MIYYLDVMLEAITKNIQQHAQNVFGTDIMK